MKNTSEKVAKSNEKSSVSVDKEPVRSWTAVLYPESLPDNWRDIISSSGVKAVLSPLHDRDINADGTPKKAHYHLILSYDGKKSFTQVSNFLAPLNCPRPEKVQSTRGLVRYFTHMDNPEKAQYDRKDIQSFNGFDVGDCFTLTVSSRYDILDEMITFCIDRNIREYRTFLKYVKNHKRETWFPVLMDSGGYLITNLIKSIRYGEEKDGHSEYDRLMQDIEREQSEEQIINVNEETGEVILRDMNVLLNDKEKSE